MEYSKKIKYIVSIFDDVLKDLKQPKMLDNKDFTFPCMQFNDYLMIALDKENSIGLTFCIYDEFGLEIHTSEMSEAYAYDIKFIKLNEELIKKRIKILLTSMVKVDSCGKNCNKLNFINDKGEIVDTLVDVEGFAALVFGFLSFVIPILSYKKFNSNYTIKIYKPIYPI